MQHFVWLQFWATRFASFFDFELIILGFVWADIQLSFIMSDIQT